MTPLITNNKYRIINVTVCNNKYPYNKLKGYKVQVKYLFFWITIKSFIKDIFDKDINFCENEAIELYNKLIDNYGKFR